MGEEKGTSGEVCPGKRGLSGPPAFSFARDKKGRPNGFAKQGGGAPTSLSEPPQTIFGPGQKKRGVFFRRCFSRHCPRVHIQKGVGGGGGGGEHSAETLLGGAGGVFSG